MKGTVDWWAQALTGTVSTGSQAASWYWLPNTGDSKQTTDVFLSSDLDVLGDLHVTALESVPQVVCCF